MIYTSLLLIFAMYEWLKAGSLTYPCYTPNVPLLCTCCTPNVPLLYPCGTPNVPLLHPQCATAVPLRHPQCAHAVRLPHPPLRSWCVPDLNAPLAASQPLPYPALSLIPLCCNPPALLVYP